MRQACASLRALVDAEAEEGAERLGAGRPEGSVGGDGGEEVAEAGGADPDAVVRARRHDDRHGGHGRLEAGAYDGRIHLLEGRFEHGAEGCRHLRRAGGERRVRASA